jgi:hypothetical protein
MTLQESYGTLFPGVLSGATTTKVYNWPSNRNLGYDGALEMVCVVHLFMLLSLVRKIPSENKMIVNYLPLLI